MSENPTPGPSTALRLRPLPLSELLDEAFRMYRSQFPTFFLVALLVGLPGLVYNFATGSYKLTGGILNSLVVRGGTPRVAPTILSSNGINPAPALVAGIIFLVAVPFLAGGLTAVAVGVAEGREVTPGAVLRRVLSRYWGIWGVGLLEGLALVGLGVIAVVSFFIPVLGVLVSLLVIVPIAFFVLIRWAVALPALLAEGSGPAAALRRSWTLVQGNWWRVFAILFFSGILVAVLGATLGFAVGLIAYLVPGLSSDDRGAVTVVTQTIAAATVSPLSAVVTTLIYFDLRVRKESVDLDQLARQAALPPAVGSLPPPVGSLPPPVGSLPPAGPFSPPPVTSPPRYRGLYTPPARPDSPPSPPAPAPPAPAPPTEPRV